MDDPVVCFQLYPLMMLFLSTLYIREWIVEDAVAVRK